MRNYIENNGAKKALFSCLLALFFAGSLCAQTYTTIADGNWSSPATWQGGIVPPTATTLPAGATINIRHTVAYDTGNTPFRVQGEVRLQPFGGSTAKLNVPSGITVEVLTGGIFFMKYASYIQCRFSPCNDGQPYDANNLPGALLNNGAFRNLGGHVEVRSSIVEVAQFWVNFSGSEIIGDSCLTAGETFAIKGTAGAFSNSIIVRSSISLGWHGPGQFELANGNVAFQSVRVQLAGANNTGFNLQFGTANGDIDYITTRNHITGFTSNAVIFASPSITTSGINLDAYCLASILNYQHNNKFTGTRTFNCGLNLFPAICSVLIPSSSGGTLEGRVATSEGLGIARAVVELSGGSLSAPLRAVTNGFGYYRFEGIEVGHSYIVSVASKQYTFPEPSRVISLMDNTGAFDFIAAGENATGKRQP